METTMIEEYSKLAGELSECKSKEDRDSWLSGFGAFILGWQARGKRLLTPDAADFNPRPGTLDYWASVTSKNSADDESR